MQIRSIEANFLYGHFHLKHNFIDGINILYGDNGGGKTTLLNILTNALNGNFNRFSYLDFSNIDIELNDGRILSISKNLPDSYESEETINVYLDNETILHIPTSEMGFESPEKKYTEIDKYNLPKIIYFPAYRFLYDYIKISSSEIMNMLSGFSPSLYFPRLTEIEGKLKNEVASGKISPNTTTFIENLNKFFANKSLKLNSHPKSLPFEIVYKDEHRSEQLTTLSSGERQIATIIFAISQAEHNSIVLIDEPEISLHVGWQRKVIKAIETICNPEQIIACTHSPVIGADYELSELEFRFVEN